MYDYDAPIDTAQADLEQIRQQIGEERIRLRKANWSTLMKQGVIASVTIGRWRGRTRLDPEDLGLPTDAVLRRDLSDLLHLGDKILLPAETLRALEAVESRARKYLINAGFKTFWGTFVPVTSYREFRGDMDICRAEYFALRDEIVRDYDTIRSNMRTAYREAGLVAYRRMSALMPDQDFGDMDMFADTFSARILANIPPAQEIAASFRFEVALSYIPLPSLLAENDIADLLAADNNQENGSETTAIDRTATDRIATDRIATDRTAALQRARALQDMNRDIVDKARRQKDQLVGGFLNDVQSQLNMLVHDACTDVLAALQNNGKLNGRNVVRIKRLIETISKLNFYDDSEIETTIQRVQQQITLCSPDNRNVRSIERTLKSIATVTRQTLIDLGERPRSARELGVPDEPTPGDLYLARRQLRLVEADKAMFDELPIFDRPNLSTNRVSG